MEKTPFSAVYNRFLSKITDDMYMELTPEDTLKDLQTLLLNSIDGFEFPRTSLYDYEVSVESIDNNDITEDDFVIKEDDLQKGFSVVDKSSFSNKLTSEEINILALLMKQSWVQRQVTSIENTRMKYSGADFKMTSQANHLAKLLSLLEESRRDSFHMQRLYRRRRPNEDGTYSSNWDILKSKNARS